MVSKRASWRTSDADSESTGRLFIKMACDWQILRLLIRANTGSGPQAEHAIHFPAVMSFVSQSLLHAHYIGSDAGPLAVLCWGPLLRWTASCAVPRSRSPGAGTQCRPTRPCWLRTFLRLDLHSANRFAHLPWQYCAERLMSSYRK